MSGSPGQKIRMLVVDDMTEAREGVRILLSLERDIEVVGVAANGQEALELTRELKPHIVLMDINMPVMDGIAAASIICREMPQVQVIMASVQEEREYLRRAMQVGAREYVIKPFDNLELTATIRRVYEQALQSGAFDLVLQPVAPVVEEPSAPPRGKVIAVFSPRGGSGKTTLVTNLALALRGTPETKVALVDASLQFGDLHLMFNLQPKRTIVDLTEKISDLDKEVLQHSMSVHSSGVQLLAAPQKPEMADLVGPESLSKVIEQLTEIYEFVLVDTASFLDWQTKAVLDLADFIILIVTPEVCCLKGAKLFCESELVRAYPSQKINVVFNKADEHSKSRLDDVLRTIHHPFLGLVRQDDETVIMAVNSGIPFFAGDSSKPISRDIYGLSKRLLKAMAEAEQPAEKPAAQPVKPAERPAEPAAPGKRAGCSLLTGGALVLLGLAVVTTLVVYFPGLM
jgi:pilus assembly protein CpaE